MSQHRLDPQSKTTEMEQRMKEISLDEMRTELARFQQEGRLSKSIRTAQIYVVERKKYEQMYGHDYHATLDEDERDREVGR